MTIWVGIDEAGYGPTLGPMCLGLLAIHGDEKGSDLWKSLPFITQDSSQWRRKLAMVDSKELHKGPLALERLESSALAITGSSSTVQEWLKNVGDWVPGELAQYPWHRDEQVIPLTTSTLHQDFRVRWLEEIAKAGLAIQATWARPVMVRRFNAMLKEGNKSSLEFAVIMDMVERLLSETRGEEIQLVCDKLGGRDRYCEILSARFPMEEVRIHAESRRESRYEIPGRKLHMTFRMGADGSQALVAGASIMAKYCRELLMRSLNDFWVGKIAGLEPTAGYPEDAKRFIAAVKPTLESMGFSPSWLVREK